MLPQPKTNEEIAQDFMAAVAASYHKHKEHLRILKVKWQITDAFDADDVIQDCLVKCYDKIIRGGLSSGYHYNAYFNTALTNNFQYYSQKRRLNKDSSFEQLVGETALNATVDYADYKVIHKDIAPLLHELSEDFTEFDNTDDEDQAQHTLAITAAFKKLPEKYQEILRMDMNGLKYKEICRVLGLRMSQCKMRLKTARDLIKAQLSAYPKITND